MHAERIQRERLIGNGSEETLHFLYFPLIVSSAFLWRDSSVMVTGVGTLLELSNSNTLWWFWVDCEVWVVGWFGSAFRS